ncbi:2-phosphosulfolactate phosphatase [Microbacterium sp.]|uniref:2-phosphosulfolactate phosphatase n=1 Tax=Microbacterium sp. TaxID=51671 RepID=UPI0039E6A1D6
MSSPFDQSRYQVRLEWGAAGLARLAPSDLVVVVDVLRFSTAVTDRVDAGHAVPLAGDGARRSVDGAVVARAAAATGATVLLGCLRNASAVAGVVLAEQRRRAARTSVAVIACGEREHRAAPVGSVPAADAAAMTAGALRFAVEDLLGAGAVIDALGALGLDHTSPEAAAAGEAFRGLRGATRHLLTASGSGQELIDRGARDEALAAAALDAAASVPVLRDGVFTAY